ncbi:unnamed protein product [Paramecium sonneborni]|uniref:Uncharacterized protein n=1 Tax=Paramecium sonneborni TaxID=65129 RepID=A0A8S1K1D3_9CILI|nr:unnamed protein product [Paramecium sonneborni]
MKKIQESIQKKENQIDAMIIFKDFLYGIKTILKIRIITSKYKTCKSYDPNGELELIHMWIHLLIQSRVLQLGLLFI